MIAEENAYRQGVHDGIALERDRILEALRIKVSSRDIFQTLAAPFFIDEIVETILEGQGEHEK